MDYQPLRYIPEEQPLTEFRPVLIPRDLHPEPKPPLRPRRSFWRAISWPRVFLFLVLPAFLIAFGLSYAFGSPEGFPVGETLVVREGETLSGVTAELSERGALRMETLFKAAFVVFGGSKGLKAGDYYLLTAQGPVELAWRLTHADYRLQDVRVTIPEGLNVSEVAALIARQGAFARFDPAEFRRIAASKEGYLFPDTYHFLPNATAQDVMDAMTANFDRRIESVMAQLTVFGRDLDQVVKMASIIEEEARTEESRRTIAGILWKRLDMGMPLQVDAAFQKVNGKTRSEELTLDDLATQSPFNTYAVKGLPPTAIANPGLAAISATVRPIKTPYLFYLSDDDGNMHYAVTNEGHEQNKDKYLR